jgi:hypothetical protein
MDTPSMVDIVVVDSYPKDLVEWQPINGLFPAIFVVKPGGCIILVSPCPEGVDSQHPEILEYGYRSYKEIRVLVLRLGRSIISLLLLSSQEWDEWPQITPVSFLFQQAWMKRQLVVLTLVTGRRSRMHWK